MSGGGGEEGPTSPRTTSEEVTFLFRGTSRGWPGNPAAIRGPFTYTSLDPVVAFLFALECRNHGEAVVVIGRRGRFAEFPVGPNDVYSQRLERSVTVEAQPSEFASEAVAVIPLERCREALANLGFRDFPPSIYDGERARRSLEATETLGERLTPEQIRRSIDLTIGELPWRDTRTNS